MNFSEFPKRLPQFNFNRTLIHLQNHCSSFLQHLSPQSFFSPNPSSFQSSQFNPNSPLFARIANNSNTLPQSNTESIEERLAGVPVYALSNPNEEFVLVTGASTGRSLGLLCFRKEDAELLLQQMKSMDPGMRKAGSKVVPLDLGKVFQLKVHGVALRFIPESSQIKNAVKVRKKAGFSDDSFSGVPVFQSQSLMLKSQDKSYRPVFFRKEDLEKYLMRTSAQQKKLNPALKGDIQVEVFEEILKSMKEGSTSTWADVVFIPPGFDISMDPADML